MRRIYTCTYSWILIIAMAISMNYAFAGTIKAAKHDTINYPFSKKKTKKSLLNFTLPPFKPGVQSSVKLTVPPRSDDKILSNVEIFPNPITDQINLKFIVSRNSNVTIKMVDVLGNDVLTMFSRRVDPGEQTLNYALNNKLNRGFYFLRVIAGTESVIKRISIL